MIRWQQKISDTMYQDAKEANYSHEQMTPLNCILANCKIVMRRYLETKFLLEEYYTKIKDKQGLKQCQETVKIIRAID